MYAVDGVVVGSEKQQKIEVIEVGKHQGATDDNRRKGN